MHVLGMRDKNTIPSCAQRCEEAGALAHRTCAIGPGMYPLRPPPSLKFPNLLGDLRGLVGLPGAPAMSSHRNMATRQRTAKGPRRRQAIFHARASESMTKDFKVMRPFDSFASFLRKPPRWGTLLRLERP